MDTYDYITQRQREGYKFCYHYGMYPVKYIEGYYWAEPLLKFKKNRPVHNAREILKRIKAKC